MTIEHARTHILSKPWGVADLRPFSSAGHSGNLIGEIWYERSDGAAVDPSLLLKILFTNQTLSIQVHPDDVFAQSIGLPNGKTEAWHILSAAPDAKVALGLEQHLTPVQLRQAVDDGSISDLVAWRAAHAGDTIFVPAGTIHAIGAGLVIAEIQQRSDATFRLFDHGRGRELHIENAMAVAVAKPCDLRVMPVRMTATRTLLVSNAHFMFEKIDLEPGSDWYLEARQETWLLVIDGSARVGSFDVATGDAVFAQSDRAHIQVGTTGLVGLVAYTGAGPDPDLMQRMGQTTINDPTRSQEVRLPISLTQAKATSTDRLVETTR